MRKLAFLSACALALAGCDPTTYIAQSSRAEAPEISCLTQPQGGCSFSQSPLRVLDEPVELPRRPYKFFPTADPLNFVDAQGKSWNAPPRTLTDGASIPKIFISIVGDPTSPEYINAAAVHDAYCGVGNERGPMYHRANWEDVHVAGHLHIVANDAVITHHAVVGNVGVGHNQAAASNLGFPVLFGTATDGGVLPNSGVVAHKGERILVVVFQILRNSRNNGPGVDTAIFADPGAFIDNGMGGHPGTLADFHIFVDHGEGFYHYVAGDFRLRMNVC